MWPHNIRYQNLMPCAPKGHQPTWLFDLDNTLHDASKGIFKQIHLCMNQAIQTLLNVDQVKANKLRIKYWHRYGATLIGIVRHHNVCPHEFLFRAHHFPIAPYIHYETGLNQALARLPGEKILLTNAPLTYARTVLQYAGISHHFQSIMSIESMQRAIYFRPKPSVAAMQQALADLGICAHQTIFIDDTPKNLKSAKQLGIYTVLFDHPSSPGVTHTAGRPLYVDMRVRSIRELSLRLHEISGINK